MSLVKPFITTSRRRMIRLHDYKVLAPQQKGYNLSLKWFTLGPRMKFDLNPLQYKTI